MVAPGRAGSPMRKVSSLSFEFCGGAITGHDQLNPWPSTTQFSPWAVLRCGGRGRKVQPSNHRLAPGHQPPIFKIFPKVASFT